MYRTLRTVLSKGSETDKLRREAPGVKPPPKSRRTPSKQIYHIHLNSDPPTCKVQFRNLYVRALLDTGSDVSILSEEIFKKKDFVKTKLQPSDVRLHTEAGNFMKVLSECQTELKYGNQKFHQRFLELTTCGHQSSSAGTSCVNTM